ncbi:AraC family transcriptional regulator [Parabacteroides faecis]|uniref:helix-turn-helix domain-containing protein n=1 Tax=Parabacteroides TaxID=375288 RepID=UPI000F00F2F9|nr:MULTISPECIES: helix-turn-helix domain-containing protein [Parabacteroides]MBC8617098.1 AraC family transcriptional regulator [Parabacteroides faecis]RHS01050.1 AraC family transcriptional regulator [Parabacteroides sp. AF14-59]
MDKILELETIHDYHSFIGYETLHPLISVIDFSKVKPLRHARKRYGFYAVVLKDVKCGDVRYGKNYYDYQEGTLVFISPGQIVGNEDTGETYQMKGWALLFHPDLLWKTPLGQKMREYTFFSYEANESLHISERERQTFLNCLNEIQEELERSIDKHSKSIITASIEVLLNYSMRFYDRQFVTREKVNHDILTRFEMLLNDYFESDKPETIGLPSVQYCADNLHLSANYFGDLIKKETGKSAQEHIQSTVINLAKAKLHDPEKTINEIAYEMGFKYPHHFSRLFKKMTGMAPTDYRQMS